MSSENHQLHNILHVFCLHIHRPTTDSKSFYQCTKISLPEQYQVRFEFSTAVKKDIVAFWIMTSCRQVGGYQQNSKTFCFIFRVDSMFLHNVCIHPAEHNITQPRKQKEDDKDEDSVSQQFNNSLKTNTNTSTIFINNYFTKILSRCS